VRGRESERERERERSGECGVKSAGAGRHNCGKSIALRYDSYKKAVSDHAHLIKQTNFIDTQRVEERL